MSMSLHVYRYVILCLCVRTCCDCLGACFKHTMVVSCFSVVCVLFGAVSTCYMSMLMHVCVYIYSYSLAMSPFAPTLARFSLALPPRLCLFICAHYTFKLWSIWCRSRSREHRTCKLPTKMCINNCLLWVSQSFQSVSRRWNLHDRPIERQPMMFQITIVVNVRFAN